MMPASDIAPLVNAVRVDGNDTKVTSIRYTEDDTGGGVLYLRVSTATEKPEGPVELVDAQGGVLMVCPDLTDPVPAGGEFAVTFGAASVPPSAPQSVPGASAQPATGTGAAQPPKATQEP